MFNSTGLKRKAATLIASLLSVIDGIPGTEQISAVLGTVNGVLGGVAISHAGVAGTLSKEKISGAVAALYALIFILHFIPQLAPIIPALQKLAGILAVAKVGSSVLS